jgi:hypothetical protein
VEEIHQNFGVKNAPSIISRALTAHVFVQIISYFNIKKIVICNKFVHAYHCNVKCTLFALLEIGIFLMQIGILNDFLFNADPDPATDPDTAQ